MLNRKPLVFLVFVGLVILGVICFQSNIFSIDGKTQEIKKDSKNLINRQDKKDTLDNKDNDIKQVIAEYCNYAKRGEFPELIKLVTKATNDDYFAFDKKPEDEFTDSGKTKQKSSKKRTKKSNVETPVMAPISGSVYESITKRVPEIIYNGRRDFYEISDIRRIENKVKVRAKLKREDGIEEFIEQDFYLIKDKEGNWKIYMIDQVVRPPQERGLTL